MAITKYSETMDTIKTGDLVAWKHTKIGSFQGFILYLYGLLTKAEYKHVAVVVVYGDRRFVVEATPPVVRMYPLSCLTDFYLIRTNLTANKKYPGALFRHLGKPYSVLDFLKGLFGIKNSTDNYYCSELVAEFYNDIGLIDDIDAGHTPDTIVNCVVNTIRVNPEYIKLDKGNLDF